MGYDVHITRAAFFHQNDGQQISEGEWLRLVEADPELRLATPADPHYFEGMVVWNRTLEGYGMPWFDWLKGNIYTKRPSGPIIAKMLAMAQLLGARVQGDLCEVYLAGGRIVDGQGRLVPDADWRIDSDWLPQLQKR